MIDTKCKICRREGQKLFLKGERCYTTKCSLVKRKYPPGIHGPKGYPRLTEYGLRLREKQRLKRLYGVSEKELKKYFSQAKKNVGNTETELLRLLEARLDNVIYRAGFALSRTMARQMINHGHFLINGRKVNIPSYQVKMGQVITLKEKSRFKNKIADILASNKGKIEPPAWIFVDEKAFSIKIVKKIEPEDLPKEINTKFIVEFYSR
jgi:small subunit ribosomal protein S4